MAKVKFNVKALDRDTAKVYPVSDEFVEVTDAFAKRLKVLIDSDKSLAKSYEFEQDKESKAKPAKSTPKEDK